VNKQDLVEALSGRLEKSQKEASETIDALVDEIKKALAKGEAIRISGFGAFEQSVRKARLGRNPRTGEPVKISATRVVRFRPAADFKAIVAGTRKAVSAAVPGGDSEPTKKAPAKKAAAPAKKAPAKKTAAKKAAAPAKKTAAKKAAAPAKKAAAKTASPAKKTAAKKTSTTTPAK
jgi:DNA-binding protein HU-beta